jgi:hypothetical protein
MNCIFRALLPTEPPRGTQPLQPAWPRAEAFQSTKSLAMLAPPHNFILCTAAYNLYGPGNCQLDLSLVRSFAPPLPRPPCLLRADAGRPWPKRMCLEDPHEDESAAICCCVIHARNEPGRGPARPTGKPKHQVGTVGSTVAVLSSRSFHRHARCNAGDGFYRSSPGQLSAYPQRLSDYTGTDPP